MPTFNQDQAIAAYIATHKLGGAEDSPFTDLPFRQLVVMLRYLQAHLEVHGPYQVPSEEEVLFAVDTMALFVNHALNDPKCWCLECEGRRIEEEKRKAANGRVQR
jgi:hypothetical protein